MNNCILLEIAWLDMISWPGLAVGLAAKEVVGNMFGGASLFISRPFVIGEKIKVDIKVLD